MKNGDVSEELSASFFKVTRIGEIGLTLAVTSNRRTLRRNVGSYKSHTAYHPRRRHSSQNKHFSKKVNC
jgi:hypothetical protein